MTEADSLRVDNGVTAVWDVSLGDWDSSLDTGMESVDQQHRALFDQIRILLDHTQANRIRETLEFIATYASEHFDMEERLHQETDYPYAQEQLDAHIGFMADYRELKQEYEGNGGDLVLLMKLAKFLLDWLKEHIGKLDQKFADYFHRLQPPT